MEPPLPICNPRRQRIHRLVPQVVAMLLLPTQPNATAAQGPAPNVQNATATGAAKVPPAEVSPRDANTRI